MTIESDELLLQCPDLSEAQRAEIAERIVAAQRNIAATKIGVARLEQQIIKDNTAGKKK